MLEEQEAVLEAVNVVDHDIDECVQTLEKIYRQKLDRLTKFGGTQYLIQVYMASVEVLANTLNTAVSFRNLKMTGPACLQQLCELMHTHTHHAPTEHLQDLKTRLREEETASHKYALAKSSRGGSRQIP